MLVLGVSLITIGSIMFFLMILSQSSFTSYLHGSFLGRLGYKATVLIMLIAFLVIVGGIACLVIF